MTSFLDVMGRKLVMNPGAFFCLDNESFSKYTKAEKEGLWARSNGRRLSAGQPQNATWWELMLPTQQVRLQDFMIKVLPPMIETNRVSKDGHDLRARVNWRLKRQRGPTP